MQRLSVLPDEPWDEVTDEGRTRVFSNPTSEPVRMLAVSSKRFSDVVGDNGVIARSELPPT
jgi:hypothetical protein